MGYYRIEERGYNIIRDKMLNDIGKKEIEVEEKANSEVWDNQSESENTEKVLAKYYKDYDFTAIDGKELNKGIVNIELKEIISAYDPKEFQFHLIFTGEILMEDNSTRTYYMDLKFDSLLYEDYLTRNGSKFIDGFIIIPEEKICKEINIITPGFITLGVPIDFKYYNQYIDEYNSDDGIDIFTFSSCLIQTMISFGTPVFFAASHYISKMEYPVIEDSDFQLVGLLGIGFRMFLKEYFSNTSMIDNIINIRDRLIEIESNFLKFNKRYLDSISRINDTLNDNYSPYC